MTDLARIIDHTCLEPAAVAADIERLCAEAREHEFHSVCVAPAWVSLAAALLRGSNVRVGSVAGFPHGNTATEAKCLEARRSLERDARDIDMVMWIGALREGNDDAVLADIAAVAETVHDFDGAVLKAILETALLTPDEVDRACVLCERAGADFVKTSTGFAGSGATEDAVRRMRAAVGDRLGVKAAGGIRDRETALRMVAAGASRIGASASVAIVTGA